MTTLKYTPVPDRPEVDLQVDGKNYTLVFNTTQQMVLEDQLKQDPIPFYFRTGAERMFLQWAIVAGLSRSQTDRLNPTKVGRILDSVPDDFDTADLSKQLLYAIARGRRGKAGKQALETLDETFNIMEEEARKSGSDPLVQGSRPTSGS